MRYLALCLALLASAASANQFFGKWRRNPIRNTPRAMVSDGGTPTDGGSSTPTFGRTVFTPSSGSGMDARTNPIIGSPTNLCISVDITPPALLWPVGSVGLVTVSSGPSSVELFVAAGILTFRVIDSSGVSRVISSVSVLSLSRDTYVACTQNGTMTLSRGGLLVLSTSSGTGNGKPGPMNENLYLKYANGATLTAGTLNSVCITDVPGTCP